MDTPNPHLLCISGSLRPVSYCYATCLAAKEIAEAAGLTVEIADPRILNLPMYVPDFKLEDYDKGQEGIEELVQAYRRADALLWVSPTYHGTISGVFKNMLDFTEFLSRDTYPYFQGRPAGLIAINDSTPFAAMRDCARELRAWLAPTQIELSADDFDAELKMSNDRSRSRVGRLVRELASFVRR